jgi:hypothetical protein
MRARVKLSISALMARGGPKKYQPAKVNAAMPMTMGTKIAETC